MFQGLTTQLEEAADKIVKQYGITAENLANKLNEDITRKLMSIDGEDKKVESAAPAKQAAKDLDLFKNSLLQDVLEDVDAVMKKSVDRFERRLDSFREEMKEQLSQGVRLTKEERWDLVRQMKSGVHDIILDKVR
jgi:hypothetical protein